MYQFSVLLLVLSSPGETSSVVTPTLAEGIQKIAGEMVVHLNTIQKTRVAVGSFVGKGDATGSSSGPRITKALTDSLKAKSIEVVRHADLNITGEYEPFDAIDREGQVVLQVKFDVVQKKEQPQTFKVTLTDEAEVAKHVGRSFGVSVDKTFAERNAIIKDAVENPKTQLAGTRIAAGPHFAIEVLTAPHVPKREKKLEESDYKVEAPKVDRGFAFIDIPKNKIYAIRLYNNSDHDAAVEVAIDGLSMFATSTRKDEKTGSLPRYIILEKNKSYLVRGRFVDLEKSDEFLVTEYGKSLAKELESTDAIGTVTCNFVAAWPKGAKPPAYDGTGKSAATGRGNRVDEKYKFVDFEVSDKLRGTASFRYSKDD